MGKVNPEIQEVINALPDRPLTIREVAMFFQVNKTTIYRWYEKGDLKGSNINGILRIYRKSVINLLENGSGKGRGEEIPEEIEAKLKGSVKAEAIKPRRSSGWVRNW